MEQPNNFYLFIYLFIKTVYIITEYENYRYDQHSYMMESNAHDTELKEVFYLQQISFNVQGKLFKTLWATVIVQNCDTEGKLFEFKSKADYATNEKNLWLNLPLKIFRENGELFPVFCCPECPSMKGFRV